MKTRLLCTVFLLAVFSTGITAQTRADVRDMFSQAEMYVLFEEYPEALPSYINLLKLYPDNANFKYRIGQCYINIPGEKEKAVPFLEDAVKNISPGHRQGKLKEKSAPSDALYYLANAYRVNNRLEEAIATYNRFLETIDTRVYDPEVVKFQLETCHNALKMMQAPLYVRKTNQGENINDRFSETNPVVSTGEDNIFFTRVLQLRRALFWSKFSEGRWSGPYDIVPDLRVDDKFYPTSISKDGKTLFLYSDFDYIGNIYVSKLVNGTWSPVEKLNENINTKFWESHATISPDGNRLYFSSNRKGGFGGLDIYVSEIDSAGNWGPAVNLGPVINTPYHEDTPFLTEDGRTLFFSSRGHYNMGGYDIFYSTLFENNEWSVPLNAGYPLNTTDDDLFFMPVGKGYQGYIARYDDSGFGEQDIFRVEIFSDDHPRKFMIRGITRIQDLRSDIAESIRVTVRDINDPNMAIVVYTDPATGKYEFEVKHGDYEITFDADGIVKEVKKISLPIDHPGDSVTIALTELEKSDFEALLRVLSDSLLKVMTGDSVQIDLYTEPRSILEILAVNEGKVIASGKINTTDTSFAYRFLPLPGRNVVNFSLTDMFSNNTTAKVVVERGVETRQQTISRPEYSRIIAERQVAAFLDILRQNADDDLKKVISTIDPKKHRFGTIDDVVSHLKDIASAKGINPERVDILTLRTAVNNNILTQAAVDYLERNTEGELNDILRQINVYDLKLRSFSDLKEYIAAASRGTITPETVDRLAAYLLTGPDPAIAIIRSRMKVYAPTVTNGEVILTAVTSTDALYLVNAGEWLETFNSFSGTGGLLPGDQANLYSAIGFPSGTDAAAAAEQMMAHAASDLKEYLTAINYRKEGIKNTPDLINLLLGKKAQAFGERDFFAALAAAIAGNELTDSDITEPEEKERGKQALVLIAGGALLIIILIILFRRKKKERK